MRESEYERRKGEAKVSGRKDEKRETETENG